MGRSQSAGLLSTVITAGVMLMLAAPTLGQGSDLSAEFVSLSSAEDVTGNDWLALAVRAREAGDFQTAAQALDMADTTLAPRRTSLERARIEAGSGNSDAAIAQLARMFDNGFRAVRLVTGDALLSRLEGDPKFDALVAGMTEAAFPCLNDAAFKEFDFWLGDWEVHTPDGQFAGTNSIRREEAGCVLTERWTGAGGNTGSSVNYVDKSTGEWVQVWNSENGAQIFIRGGLTDDGMAMSGHLHNVAAGTTVPFRALWTLLEDGRVRQFFEQSSDDGETWAPWFEGLYTRQTGDE